MLVLRILTVKLFPLSIFWKKNAELTIRMANMGLVWKASMGSECCYCEGEIPVSVYS